MQKILTDSQLGANIRRVRESKGMSQADVVRELQLKGRLMSVSHYGHIEQCRKNIFARDLALLKVIFDVDYEEFFIGLLTQD